jgi:1,4-dihydroxy-2-naphthoyl-CoA hydrolase
MSEQSVPADQPVLPDLRDLSAHLAELMPLAALLGIEAVAASATEARLRLPWSPRRCTSGGVLHGGALMTLADTAAGWLAFLNLPPGATGTTTTDSSTRFLAAVREGHAEAVARLLHKGRTLIVIDTEIRDRAHRLVARTSQAQLVLTPR